MRKKAILKRLKGDGMGTAKIEVMRLGDNKSLGTIRYQPDSPASCKVMEMQIADIQGRYQVDVLPE